MVKTKDQKNTILRINVVTSKVEVLLPYSYEHRSYPKLYKDYLLYNSSYNGIDNIYAMHLPTKACFQVTSRKYGAYLGMVDPITNQLVFNDYTKNGMDIAVMPFDPLSWTPLEEVEDKSIRYYEPLVAQENNSDILEKVPNHVYPLATYNFAKDDATFIGPAMAPDWDDRSIKVEPFSLVNLQETLKATPYFYQNFNILNKVRSNPHKTTELGFKVRYRTFYPVLKVDIKGSRYKQEESTVFDGLGRRLRIPNEISWIPALKLGIKLPYYFTLGSSSGKTYLKAEMDLSRCDTNKKIGYITTYTFNIKNVSTKSKRDLYAPWSQELNICFNDFKKSANSLWEYEWEYKNNDLWSYKNTLCFNAEFYIPGIANHHYFKVNPIITQRLTIADKSHWTQQINLVYGCPLAHPECGIPLIWFLEKIWIEGYYHSKTRNINQMNAVYNPTSDTIGTKLWFLSRVLSNKAIPLLKFSMDFCFLEKENNKDWKFKLPIPTPGFAFDVFNRRKVNFTKKINT
ncbi:hypothetical protein [Cardinium endosymbiont of Dermatophagoides farinae]|uniref:hypothetical protein n=1 Tax=Cardinium endosymbiont of Dermatophagoides farinae TaxID=2597823 RepID=UPI001183ECC3|nr:hypothetical protein [Cardinium endosymbiont of Dermatophagoides farinae]TSJ81400.1 hypothetical protein FPG78_05470 [Cardinium endosymbiont of Dermatophagoides farinae]